MDYKEILIQSLTIGTANGGKFEFFSLLAILS